MPQNHSMVVVASPLLPDVYEGAPGALRIETVDTYLATLHAICSCGCGTYFSIPLRFGAFVKGERGWGWDGADFEHITLTPSIRQVGGCQWHGHLLDGRWHPAEDSGK